MNRSLTFVRLGFSRAGFTGALQCAVAMVCLALLGLCIGIGKRSESESELERFFQKIEMESSADAAHAVDNAVSSDRAIIFVHVRWSTDSYFAGQKFRQFAARYSALSSSPAIGFHAIDCTSDTDGYAVLKKLAGWRELELARGGESLIGGYGEFVWLERGRVVAVERLGSGTSPADLVAQAQARWQAPP